MAQLAVVIGRSGDNLLLAGGLCQTSAESQDSADLGRWVLLLQQVNDLRKVSMNEVIALGSEGRGQETTGLLDLLFDLGFGFVLADKVLSSADNEGAESALDIIYRFSGLLNNGSNLDFLNSVVGAELDLLADLLWGGLVQQVLNDLVSINKYNSVAKTLKLGREVAAGLNKSLLNFRFGLVNVLFSVSDNRQADVTSATVFLSGNARDNAESCDDYNYKRI
jgi:hypothetical protein